jgi:dihydroorotate dehydrogenase
VRAAVAPAKPDDVELMTICENVKDVSSSKMQANYPMSQASYTLLRRILFSLDPELAHESALIALALAQRLPFHKALFGTPVLDPVSVAGLHFPNRVGLAAGLDKDARCIHGLRAMGFGFIELGTVTPRPQPGNPKPRLFRLPPARAIINRFGFNNAGLTHFIANILRDAQGQGETSTTLVGLNIGKNADTALKDSVSDYLTCLDAVYPLADYVTINISSPNTKDLRSLQIDDALDQLLDAIATRRNQLANCAQGPTPARRVPIFVKIAPDLSDSQIASIAAALLRYGMDGVIATNTTLSRDGVHAMAHANESGGLSGAPLLARSNHVIFELRGALGPQFPIIGVGGILSAEDAVSKIRAGADLVQIYTGLIYAGPSLVRQAALAIKALRAP